MVVALVQSGFSVGSADAAPGDLDPSFGANGRVLTDAGAASANDVARGVAVQADGKIVAAGAAGPMAGGLVRYISDGSLDPSFHGDGRVAAVIVPRDLAIQPDGKILVAGRAFTPEGSSTGDFAIARYNPDGTLDPGFGVEGIVVTQFPPASTYDSVTGFANRVLIQGDGKILAGGVAAATRLGVPSSALAVGRYHPDGSLDSSFGRGGKQVVPAGREYTPEESGLARQPDGKIVLATTSADGDFFLVRLTPDGVFLDLGFNGSGMVRTNLFTSTAGESYDRANDVAIQNGKIVAAGATRGPGGGRSDFALVRYHLDGSLDDRFSGDGKLVTDFGPSDSSDPAPDDLINRVAIRGDGKLVAGGCAVSADACSATGDFALAAYNPEGTLDTAFGAGGRVTTSFGSGLDMANDVAFHPADGKLLAVGQASNGTEDVFALARYFPPPALPSAPPALRTPRPAPVTNAPPDTRKPTVRALSVSPRVFRVAGSGPGISQTLGGTIVSFRVSEAASVRFRVERAFQGRRIGRTCVRPSRSNRRKRRCTRYVTLRGSFAHRSRAGANRFRFRGRLRGRKLRPGRYRLRAVATDAAKNSSAPKRKGFRIVVRR